MGSGHDLEALTRPGVDNDFAIGACVDSLGLMRMTTMGLKLTCPNMDDGGFNDLVYASTIRDGER